VHAAKLRVELSQSKAEQQEYLKNVELARVLDKRVAKKREKGEDFELKTRKRANDVEEDGRIKKKKKANQDVSDILSSVF
jgi:ESF2/ABP1 family protein